MFSNGRFLPHDPDRSSFNARISNDDLGTIWVNCTDASESYRIIWNKYRFDEEVENSDEEDGVDDKTEETNDEGRMREGEDGGSEWRTRGFLRSKSRIRRYP